MPKRRCRYFDDSGNPVNGGCFRNSCAFVHPNDSGWSSAVSDGSSFRSSSSNGRGRGRGNWNDSTRNDSGFSSSAWSSQAPAVSDTRSSSSRRDYPSSRNSAPIPNAVESSSSGWGGATEGWGVNRAPSPDWGDKDTTSTSDKPKSSGWGDIPTWGNELTSSSAGWGDSVPTTSGQAVETTSTSGWGSAPVSSGWGDAPASSGWGNETTWGSSSANTTVKDNQIAETSSTWQSNSAPVPAANASSSTAPSWSDPNAGSTWGNTASSWGDQSTEQSSGWDTGRPQDNGSVPADSVNAIPVANRTVDKGKARETPAIPIGSRSVSNTPRRSLSRNEDVEMRPPPDRSLSLPRRAESIVSSEPDSNANVEMDSKDAAYRERVALTLEFAELKMRAIKATKVEERWKRTQASSVYEMVREAGKQKLDSLRIEFKSNRIDLEHKVKAKGRELAACPSLAVHVSEDDLREARTQVVQMRKDLEQTVQEFEQATRKEDGEAEEASALKDGEADLQRLLDRMKQFKAICTGLENEVTEITDEFPSPAKLLEEAEKAQSPSSEEDILRKQLQERTAQLLTLRLRLKEKRDILVPLRDRVNSSKADTEKLFIKQQENVKMRDEIKMLVRSQQDALDERKHKLDENNDKVRNLHNVQRPSVSQPFDMAAFQPFIQKVVDEIITGSVQPELKRMQDQFHQDLNIAHQDVQTGIRARLDPIVTQTNWIYGQARRLHPP